MYGRHTLPESQNEDPPSHVPVWPKMFVALGIGFTAAWVFFLAWAAVQLASSILHG
jgi:hypothetical protein